jgi:ribonuclease PH
MPKTVKCTYATITLSVDCEVLERVGGLQTCCLNAVLPVLPIHGRVIVCAQIIILKLLF